MYLVQRSGRFNGSTASNIAMAIEASKLHEVITGAPLGAWIVAAGWPPGTFGWTSWVETLDQLATRNAQLIASDMWGKLEVKAANVASEWGVDQISQVIVLADVRGKVAQPGSRFLQSIVRANQTADPMEMLQWATKMAEVTGRVSGGSAGLSQCGFGPDWGTYLFSQLYPDAKGSDLGVARIMASAEYLSVFMEGRKYVDTSTMRRGMMVKIA